MCPLRAGLLFLRPPAPSKGERSVTAGAARLRNSISFPRLALYLYLCIGGLVIAARNGHDLVCVCVWREKKRDGRTWAAVTRRIVRIFHRVPGRSRARSAVSGRDYGVQPPTVERHGFQGGHYSLTDGDTAAARRTGRAKRAGRPGEEPEVCRCSRTAARHRRTGR